MTYNLDDVSSCPVENDCMSCGTERDLEVLAVESQVGVFCVTVCPACDPDGWKLPLVWTANRVLVHCEHLGITADEMDLVQRREHASRREDV